MSSCRTWCYTLNNPTEEETAQFRSFDVMRHRCALEEGESGTPHLQGVITFRVTYRLSALKKLSPRVHWEPSRSTAHAFNYCTKGQIIIDVNNSKQGSRTDLKNVVDLVRSGVDIYETDPSMYVKYERQIETVYRMEAMKKGKSVRDVVCIFLHGPPGVGKTRYVYDHHSVDDIYSVTIEKDKVWFDGYRGQDVLLLDDYSGQIDYTFLLRVLDRYPLRLPVKCSSSYACWTIVYITSNTLPEVWYKFKDISALLRRISQVVTM